MTDSADWEGPGTVVLGVGSPLMGDDGLGVLIVQVLRALYRPADDIAFLDGGTWGMQLLPYIESARRLLLLDVIRAGVEPGTVLRLEGEALPRHLHHKLSPHQIDLGEVLALAELRGRFPAEAVALGIEPDRIEFHDGLSNKVRAAVPELLDAAQAQLGAWGHRVRGPDVSERRRTTESPLHRASTDRRQETAHHA